MSPVSDRLEAIEGDITRLAAGAIVNAANSALMRGGGVDGAIRKRAGPEIEDDLSRAGSCAEGAAVLTPGYRLPAEWVIHTVAPIWAGRGGGVAQNALLARCYEAALTLADENGIRTIAFPAIGTGAYRWPPEIAARIAFDAVVAHLKRCETQTMVTFCCFSRADRERYADLIAGLRE
jgi:O-acetyl-ADP-ribose deacetylase (regulator of RNase III)